MSTEVEYRPEQTAASLVTGILSDLQQLLDQQLRLTRREIEEELRQRAFAAAVFGLGVATLFLSAFVDCLALSHFLHWMASPSGADPASLPLWVCHTVLTTILTFGGVSMTLVGLARFRNFTPFQNPVTEILQEPVRWTTPPK